MIVSDEEKRWLVVGIALNKIAAPVLRDFIKQGMDTHYTNLEMYCSGLATPCTLKTLTYHQVSTDPRFEHLKFENVNNNLQLYGMKKKDLHKYNYNINSSVDLAKLFLPDYLAKFSGFDESLDISAILRLLEFNKPAPIFYSPNPLISIQLSANDVKENVRNTWGHCNVNDWTEAFFSDCFTKLKTLVRSLGLTTPSLEKMALDRLSDWETKGCQLCMGHAVDHNLLSLVQQDVKKLIMDYKTTEESLAQQRVDLTAMQNTLTSIQDQQSATGVQLEEHDKQLLAVLEWKEQQMKETKEILAKLVSVEKMLSEELLIRVKRVEKGLAETDDKVAQLEQGFVKRDDKVEQLVQGFAKTDDRVEQLEQGFAKTDDKVEQMEQGFAKTDDKVEKLEQGFAKTDATVGQLEQGFAKTDDKVEQLVQGFAKTDDKVEQLEQGFAKIDATVGQLKQGIAKTDIKVEQLEQGLTKGQVLTKGSSVQDRSPLRLSACSQSPVQISKTQSDHPQNMFDVKTCQRKLREHYQKTAKVPTTAWSSVLQVDLEQIYTRLSWVKQEQTTAGPSQKELNHYTEIFTEKTNNGDVAKRILVQGETGIGKTTFVKKLLVDWSNLEEAKMDEERKDALRKFDLVVSINLKEVSKCQTLKEVLSGSRLFPEDDEKSVDDLLRYMRMNQDKILLVFDGYDEYRTGSEAEERYGSRSNSPIFKIFHGNILRDCTVLVTTRSSRADELRGPVDIQAEITGFNIFDRENFMRKMLDSETEVDDLLTFLCSSGMHDLARVPLLSLFFCLLWKEEKQKLVELTERKAKLYQAIVKHILQHSHRRHSSSTASKLNETDYNEILAEIGNVALAGLLKGDLVFEFGQLPEKVRHKEGIIVGLFQFSEHGPSLEPMEMLSFIHKSIQEYLAAWYLVYSCVPKGNLGEVEQDGATLEDCEALENVFQFVSGLSEEGAIKVLEHLKNLRISDPTLDLSKTILDIETECYVPLCEVTDRHERFSYLLYDYFREVQSKAKLLSHFLDCTGGVILVTRDTLLSELIPDVTVLIKLARNLVFIPLKNLFHSNGVDSITYKSLEFLDCLQLSVRITESSDVLKVEDLIRKLQPIRFRTIICLQNGQFKFYITELYLERDDHARPFTESTSISAPPDTSSLCSQQSCLKFLTSLYCRNLSDQTVRTLGAVIRSCEHLYMIDIVGGEESMCYLLDQVPNPSKCSVTIGACFVHPDVAVDLASEGTVQLASLLPRFNNIITLVLDVRNCCAAALNALVTGITHKTVKKLILIGIKLTPAAAEALGRSLSEVSSLQVLELYGMDGSILQAEEMKALFGRFNKTLPLCKLTLSSFSEIHVSCLAQVNESFRFFPNLRELHLEKVNLNEHDLYGLLKSWSFIRNLTELNVLGNQPGHVHCYSLGIEKSLTLGGVNLTSAVAMTLGRVLPEMSSLQELRIYGIDGSILQAEEMKALFGRFNKTLPLYQLTFSSFSEIRCLAPLNQSLRFFPNLRALHLEKLNVNDHDLCGLLENWSFICNLTELHVRGDQPGRVHCYPLEIENSLTLAKVNLTSAVATTLGRILPEMSSLQVLELYGMDGSILQAEEMKALFGRFYKTLPLYQLTFCSVSEICCLSPLNQSLRFFPNLRALHLEKLNVNDHDLCGLLESWNFFRNLTELRVCGNQPGRVYCTTFGTPESLTLDGVNLTSAVATALGRILPETSSLQTLKLTGVDGSILQTKELEALFGKLHKPLPLHKLDITDYDMRGSLAPLIKSLRFFPRVRKLEVTKVNMDEDDQCGLLESLKFIPDLTSLELQGRSWFLGDCGTARLTFTSHSSTLGTSKSLNLHGISLTPATTASLGRSFPEMSSLETLELEGHHDGRILQAEVIEALFGGVSKIMRLSDLTVFPGLNVTGSIAPLTNVFCFFPNLTRLCLVGLHMDEHNLCGLLESLQFTPKLMEPRVCDGRVGRAHCSTTTANQVSGFTHEALRELKLIDIDVTPAVAVVLGRFLPEMLSLQNLSLQEVQFPENVEGMEALFGGFNKKLPLVELFLSNSGFDFCPLGPAAKSFRFFPDLEQLHLEGFVMDEHNLCALLENLRFIPNLKKLNVNGGSLVQFPFFPVGVDTMPSITHRTLEQLKPDEVSVTPVAAALVGRSLPEMSSQETVELTDVDGNISQAEEMEALFGGFRTLRNSSLRDCLTTFFKGFHALPNLKTLKLERLSLSERGQCDLLESLRFIPSVRELSVKSNRYDQGHAHRYNMQDRFSSFTLEARERLHLTGINLTPAAATALGRSLPEMSSLQVLQLTGMYGSILQAEEIEALFCGFNKTLPLCKFTFSGFSVRGRLAPLIKSPQFFVSLKELKLETLAIDEHDQCGLLKSFGFIRNLGTLSVDVFGENFRHPSSEFKTFVSHADGLAILDGINLTLAVAKELGQLLREMSSLQDLELKGEGSTLGAEEMEALFGGFSKIMPLYRLTFFGFSVGGSFAPLNKSFRFFPNLTLLLLEMLNIGEHDLRGLLESFPFIPNLQKLSLSGNPLGHAVKSLVPHVINLKKLQYLWIGNTGHSEEDLIYVRDSVQQARPEIQVDFTAVFMKSMITPLVY